MTLVILLAATALAAQPAASQTPTPTPEEEVQNDDGTFSERPRKREEKDGLPGWNYAGNGLQYRSESGNFYQWFTLRNQIRLSHPFDDDPTTVEDFPDPGETDLALNRSRFKMGGFAGRPWVATFLEVDLKRPVLYHLFVTVKKVEWLKLRAGQWKVEFNRERVASSGDQQFVDRSIVNRDFTLDGQIGGMAMGRLGKERLFDSQYFLGLFLGAGRLSGNDDSYPMYLARYQWNFFGRDAGFSETDVEYSERRAGTVGFAAAWNRGKYTRFSSSGGTELDGFEPGVAGQYELEQQMVDFAYFHEGLSAQGETHWKRVIDRVNGSVTDLRGAYAQAGYFPYHLWPAIPARLELAARVAYVDPNTGVSSDSRSEVSVAVNWYINQHRNKINFDLSRIGVDDPAGGESEIRVRLQWDLSL
jgi:hypothetical protein